MTVTSYPGVYVEELPGGAKVIEAAGTSTAAFFGVADKGPVDEMRKIFNFSEFVKHYGDFRSDGQFLAHSVFQFFNNGGKECYIGRVASGATTASITLYDRGSSIPDFLGGPGTPGLSLTISAISPGVWGNALNVRITSAADKPNVFNLTVIEEVENTNTGETEARQVEEFEGLSMTPGTPTFVETVINSNSDYIQVTVETSGTPDENTVTAYSESGDIVTGGTILESGERLFQINIQGDGFRTIDITSRLDGQGGDPDDLNDIAQAIQETIRGLTPQKSDANILTAYANATVTVVPGGASGTSRLRILSGYSGQNSTLYVIDATDTNTNAAGPLMLGANRGVEINGSAFTRPNDTPVSGGVYEDYRLGDHTPDSNVSAVTLAVDGPLPQPVDYINAFPRLDKIRDVSLIAVPGVGSSAVADSGMNYCRNRPLSDCFYIADMPRDYDELADAQLFQTNINTPNSYGAAYFPWLKMLDPTGKSPLPIAVPPSGFVTGMYAQIDTRRGVWKAPAGTEAVLGGAVGLRADLTDQEQGNLNKDPKSICVIRKFPDAGIVLWGSRTLSNDPEYKYIPVRRTAIMLRKSIYNGIQWAVFEPNDEPLWSALRLNIGSFMNGLFRAGAFQGTKASDAYFVRCGLGDTMTQGDIDRGQVIVLVGFAPLKPAEFVIVRIQQIVGQQ